MFLRFNRLEQVEFKLEKNPCTGMMLNEDSIFWPIYMTIMLFVFGVAYGSIITKTFMEKFKEYKLQKTLKINIQTLISTTSQDTPQKINNWKYNGPLLTG